MYQASWAVIKWGEDSQVMIVTKVVNKNLFSQPFSENLWTAGSNSVPILSAAMGIFFKIGHWTWIPTFERVRSPASLSSEAGNLSRVDLPPPPKRSGKCEKFWLWLSTLDSDYIHLETNFTPKKYFLTTDPLRSISRHSMIFTVLAVLGQLKRHWKYTKMQFSASSQRSKICFGFQWIIFNG